PHASAWRNPFGRLHRSSRAPRRSASDAWLDGGRYGLHRVHAAVRADRTTRTAAGGCRAPDPGPLRRCRVGRRFRLLIGDCDIRQTLAANWRLVLLGMMLSTMTTVSFYMITVYTPTFGGTVLHLAGTQNMVVTLCVGASNFFWLPVMGALSDKTGRRPLLFAV